MNEGANLGYVKNNLNLYNSTLNANKISLVANNSNQNHLSASPLVNDDQSIYRNRRIYETGEDYTTLMTSARYFYKKNANDLEVQGYFGYKTDTTSFYIGDIFRDNSDLEMILPFTFVEDTMIFP